MSDRRVRTGDVDIESATLPKLPTGPAPGAEASGEVRPWGELRSSGLLWLINRVVFHPRGWALAITYRDGEATGWKLLGDGREVWHFNGDEDANFAAAQATLAPLPVKAEDE